jgi:sugar (pentulose or hexulose) kinase
MYLGIDIGTSGVKALLLDQSHTVIGSCSAPLSVSRWCITAASSEHIYVQLLGEKVFKR